MEIGSIVDLKREIASKREWLPTAEVQRYCTELYAEYLADVYQYQKDYRVFNDRPFSDYLQAAEDDLFKYVPPPVDPNDWRNFIRSGEERNKLDGLLAFMLDLNFRCEPSARDFIGTINEDMGEVAEAYLRFMNILDDSYNKDQWKDLAMFAHGTVFGQVKFNVRERMRKIAEEWNPRKPIASYSYRESAPEEVFTGVETTLWKPNRVFLADVSKLRMSDQDHIWYEAVVPYAKAREMFGTWHQWQYVKPEDPTADQWTDTTTDVETEEKLPNDKVRIRWRESEFTQELTIFCNKVLMTPLGLKLPEGCYSMYYQQASLLHPEMAYGRSFLDNMRSYVAVKDVLSSILVDTSRQGLEPPLKSRFRTMVNRYMFKPATVTPMQGDGDLSPLIPPNQIQNFVFEALKVYDQMIDKPSISPVFQGQQSKGTMTKFEVEQMLTQSIRAVAGHVGACVARRRQEAQLQLRIGLNHIRDITNMNFEVEGSLGAVGRSIKLGKIPENKQAYLQALADMSKAQNFLRKRGTQKKFYLVDPDKTKDYSFVLDYRINPQQHDSKTADQQEVKDKIASYREAPNINQRAVDKMLIKLNNDDESELLNPEQKPQPGQPQGQQGGQPGMPPQPPGGAPSPQEQAGLPPQQELPPAMGEQPM